MRCWVLAFVHLPDQVNVPLTDSIPLPDEVLLGRVVGPDRRSPASAEGVLLVVHHAAIVIGEAEVVDHGLVKSLEVMLFSGSDVLLNYLNVFVPIGAALRVVDAKGVQKLVFDNTGDKAAGMKVHGLRAKVTLVTDLRATTSWTVLDLNAHTRIGQGFNKTNAI